MNQSTSAILAPSLVLAGFEPARALLDLAHAQVSSCEDLPRGDGRAVLVIPGLGANHRATRVLRGRLGELGYLSQDWGQGINRGPQSGGSGGLEEWVSPMLPVLDALTDQTGLPVRVVGWSLGGIAGRELAKLAPSFVDRVITLGTPLTGLGTATRAGWVYSLLNGGAAPAIAPAVATQIQTEPPCPTVAVYSTTDGVVSWRASLQPAAQRTRHVEVPGVSHLGLVLSPKVLRVLARELQPCP